jgi:hypothetical protein
VSFFYQANQFLKDSFSGIRLFKENSISKDSFSRGFVCEDASVASGRLMDDIRSIIPDALIIQNSLDYHSLNVGSAHPPHTQGKVQSAVSFAPSGMYRLHTEALIGFMERQTTSNLPSGLSLPIMAGLER